MHAMSKDLHPTYMRLSSFTTLPDKEIRERMGMEDKEGQFTNWKTRGISIEGMLIAQAAFGVNANWLKTGEGLQSVAVIATKTDDPLSVMAAGYGVLLKQIPDSLRKEWHSYITQETLQYLVSNARPDSHGTNPADK